MSPFPYLEASHEDFSEIMIFLVQCSTHTTILPGGPRPGKRSKLFSWLVKKPLGQRNRRAGPGCAERPCARWRGEEQWGRSHRIKMQELPGVGTQHLEGQRYNTGTPTGWACSGGRSGNEWKRLAMASLCSPDSEAGNLQAKTGQDAAGLALDGEGGSRSCSHLDGDSDER